MRVFLFLAAMTSCALAQQQQQQSPREQALSAKVLQEVGNSIQCNETVIALQQRISDLEKQLKGEKK